MKRCPECEFIYYDDQEHCDMDGTRLMFTTTLPPVTEGAAPPKSIWGALAIPLLATLVLGAVLFILYRPATRSGTSLSPAPTKPASQRMSDSPRDAQLPPSSAAQPPVNAPADSPASEEPANGPANSTKPKVDKPDSSGSPANEKSPAQAPSHIQGAANSQTVTAPTSAKPAATQVANQTSPASAKPASGLYSSSSHPNPPGATASATPKPASQNANKDSKVNSFFKKAGKILKKPF